MINPIKKIHNEFKNLSQRNRHDILLVAVNMFLLLFSYPLIRSVSTAIFVESYGAKNTPLVWILSVVALALFVSLFNKLQKTKNIFYLYRVVVTSTLVTLLVCNFLYYLKFNPSAYFYYVWKEVYIVLLVHLSLGYLNARLDFKIARIAYGPLGALGSFGGVLGGEFTNIVIPWVNKNIAEGFGLIVVGIIGILILSISAFIFRSSDNVSMALSEPTRPRKSPLGSVKEVKSYVLLIAAIVGISQFVINLANFKFNLGLEQFITGAEEKGAFLGRVYRNINFLSFIFQIFLIPILFRYLKVKWIHFMIPFIYTLVFFTTLGPIGGFAPIMVLFVIYKGLDYSIFSAAKEMLYFPLGEMGRYGAKYIVDMIVYRASKMLISVVLLYYNSAFFVDCTLGICLIVWVVLTAFLFANNDKINQGV